MNNTKIIPRHPKGRIAGDRRPLHDRLVVYCGPEMLEKVHRLGTGSRVSCSDVIRFAVEQLDETEFVAP